MRRRKLWQTSISGFGKHPCRLTVLFGTMLVDDGRNSREANPMKRLICIGVRVVAVAGAVAALGCPAAGFRTTFEIWLVNDTQSNINQIVLTNHITQQADNV